MPLPRLLALALAVLALAVPARAGPLDQAQADLAQAEQALSKGDTARASALAKLATESAKQFASSHGDAYFDVVFPVLAGADPKELARSVSDLKLEIQIRDQIAKAVARGDEALAAALKRALGDASARREVVGRVWGYFQTAPLARAMACVGVALKAQDYVGLVSAYRKDGGLGLAQALLENASFTAKLTRMGLDHVKNKMVAGLVNPDCADLVQGVISVPGYPSQGKGLDIDALAARLPAFDPATEGASAATPKAVDKAYAVKIVPILMAYLNSRVRKSSMDTALDQEVRTEIMRTCGPEIKRLVLASRRDAATADMAVLAEVRGLLGLVAITGVTPQSLEVGGESFIRLEFSSDPEQALEAAEALLEEAGASNPALFMRYDLELVGPDGTVLPLEGSDLFNERTAQAQRAGNHTLRAALSVSGLNPAFGAWGRVDHRATGVFTLPARAPEGSATLAVSILTRDEAGDLSPLPARISLDNGPDIQTDSGNHTFQGVAPGTRHVRAVAPGFGAGQADIAMEPEQDQSLEIILEPAPTLRVELRRSPEGTLVDGESWINLRGGPGVNITQPGPARVFTDLAPGAYTVEAKAEGLKPVSRKTAVGDVLEISLVLDMAPTASRDEPEDPSEEEGQGYSIDDDPFYTPEQDADSLPDMDKVAALTAGFQDEKPEGEGRDHGRSDSSQAQSEDYLSPWVSLSEEEELDGPGGKEELEAVEMHAGLDTAYRPQPSPGPAASPGESGYYPGGVRNPYKQETLARPGEVSPGSVHNPHMRESPTQPGEVRASQPGNIQAVNPYKVTAVRSSGKWSQTAAKQPAAKKSPQSSPKRTASAKPSGQGAAQARGGSVQKPAQAPTSGTVGMLEVYRESQGAYRLVETIPLRYAKITSSQQITYAVPARPASCKFVLKAEPGKKMWATSVNSLGTPHTPGGQPSGRLEFKGSWSGSKKTVTTMDGSADFYKAVAANTHPVSITAEFKWNAPASIGGEAPRLVPHWKKFTIRFK